MPTPGELLARQLKGDPTVSDEDILKSSEEYMKAYLVNTNSTVKIVYKPKEKD